MARSKQTESKLNQRALPPAPHEAKERLAWDAMKCMWVQKEISQIHKEKHHHHCLICV